MSETWVEERSERVLTTNDPADGGDRATEDEESAAVLCLVTEERKDDDADGGNNVDGDGHVLRLDCRVAERGL